MVAVCARGGLRCRDEEELFRLFSEKAELVEFGLTCWLVDRDGDDPSADWAPFVEPFVETSSSAEETEDDDVEGLFCFLESTGIAGA